MKFISKQNEPQNFSDWKALSNDDWKPTYGTLCGHVKTTVKTALMVEQGYLCCYCESELIDSDSHIEHFIPQSHLFVDPLDFSNMLCSCQNLVHQGEPLHCGNLKGSWFDPILLISPLDATCEAQFTFTGDGHIQSASEGDQVTSRTDPASITIEKLGLNSPKLRNLRSNAIAPFLDENLSPQDLTNFVTAYLQPDSSGKFNAFWTTIRYIFGAYME